jgi:endonuclease/exonuclease/phosphatase (EEP) superfamily protein YafD
MEYFIWIITYLLYFIGTIAILLTILPFLRFTAWWIRIGEFPRLQIAFVCVTVLIALSFLFPILDFSRTIFLLLLVFCAVYQIYCVLPYIRLYPNQVEKSRVPVAENVIKLFIYNVLITNRESEKLLNLIEKTHPDLVLLAEPDERWLNEVAELKKTYPYFVEYPLDNAYGIALYSKLKLENTKLEFLVEDDIPSIHTDVVLRSGKKVNLYCLHPRPPVPTENFRSLERDAELLIVGKIIDKKDEPTIVCGDLNDVAWSWTTKLFQRISGLLDPRIGRGLYSTFPVAFPIVRCPLDHLFHSKHFRLVELERQPDIGSDHFPMYISLALEKTAEFTQEEPIADAEEHAEAEEMIEEAFETLEKEKQEEAEETVIG